MDQNDAKTGKIVEQCLREVLLSVLFKRFASGVV